MTDPITAWRQRVKAVIPGQFWPYGATRADKDRDKQERLIAWAEAYKVRYSDRGQCLHWIATGRCSVGLCMEGRSNKHTWMDHVTGWVRDGKPAFLIAQPYHISPHDCADLAQVSRDWDLDFDITGAGWYGHGTVMIKLWPRQKTAT